MKQVLLSLAAVTTLSLGSAAWAQRDCRDLFSSIPQATPMSKTEYVSKLVQAGVDSTAYVVNWTAIKESARGPFPESGEFVVSGVPWRKAGEWMEAVGESSIGLIVTGLPESNPGTAGLRIGNQYYKYNRIHDARYSGEGSELFYSVAQPRREFTELTISVTPEEMKAVEEFITARQKFEIVAKRDIRGGASKGEPIQPDFDIEKMGLVNESCAGACTSWFNPQWLSHYDAPEVLRGIADRLELKATPVAKQAIWGHVRRPGPMGITLFGIDRENIGETVYAQPDLMTNFIVNNAWFKLRGMPAYGYIPDPQSGLTTTIRSTRTPLKTWLGEQGVGQ
ncbi:MAG: hypothetical protein JNJ49_14430 [Bdellovibrionaceae bacterium]|nr:hypothetical protein [Pseudobdellovibrionaceae bacterium]